MKFVALNRISSQKVELVFVEESQSISVVVRCTGNTLVGDYLVSDSLISSPEANVTQEEVAKSILVLEGFSNYPSTKMDKFLTELPELLYTVLRAYKMEVKDNRLFHPYKNTWVVGQKDYKSGEFEFK